MFTSQKLLINKSGQKGVDRDKFIQELVNEYYSTTDTGI